MYFNDAHSSSPQKITELYASYFSTVCKCDNATYNVDTIVRSDSITINNTLNIKQMTKNEIINAIKKTKS